MRISDWSSDVCSSDLPSHISVTGDITNFSLPGEFTQAAAWLDTLGSDHDVSIVPGNHDALVTIEHAQAWAHWQRWMRSDDQTDGWPYVRLRGEVALVGINSAVPTAPLLAGGRSEEHTSELQSLMRRSYAGFCLKKKK